MFSNLQTTPNLLGHVNTSNEYFTTFGIELTEQPGISTSLYQPWPCHLITIQQNLN